MAKDFRWLVSAALGLGLLLGYAAASLQLVSPPPTAAAPPTAAWWIT
jgi:hypothetical protein